MLNNKASIPVICSMMVRYHGPQAAGGNPGHLLAGQPSIL